MYEYVIRDFQQKGHFRYYTLFRHCKKMYHYLDDFHIAFALDYKNVRRKADVLVPDGGSIQMYSTQEWNNETSSASFYLELFWIWTNNIKLIYNYDLIDMIYDCDVVYLLWWVYWQW